MTESTVAVLGVPSPLPNNLPLPEGWDLSVDEEGLIYYLHPGSEVTTWTDPRFPMPKGFEERRADGGGAIYVRLETGSAPEVVVDQDPRGEVFHRVLAHLALPIDTGRFEPRIAQDTRTVYFRDHAIKGTTWEDPRAPLPDDWTERKDMRGISVFLGPEGGAGTYADPRWGGLLETGAGGFLDVPEMENVIDVGDGDHHHHHHHQRSKAAAASSRMGAKKPGAKRAAAGAGARKRQPGVSGRKGDGSYLPAMSRVRNGAAAAGSGSDSEPLGTSIEYRSILDEIERGEVEDDDDDDNDDDDNNISNSNSNNNSGNAVVGGPNHDHGHHHRHHHHHHRGEPHRHDHRHRLQHNNDGRDYAEEQEEQEEEEDVHDANHAGHANPYPSGTSDPASNNRSVPRDGSRLYPRDSVTVHKGIHWQKRYDKVKKIAEGGFGSIILARPKGSSEALAVVKLLDVRGDREKRSAALREVYVHGRCSSHGNVVEFREAFVGQNTIAIAMEFAPNGTLHDIIASRREGDYLPESHIMFWFACALSAVGFMHRHGVVHRDIKPGNCLINGNSTLLLADFGFAAHVDKAKLQSDRGDFFGTPESLPPEVFAGQPHSFEGDIWSLGVLLYALAALRVPFAVTNPNRQLPLLRKKITTEQPPPLPTHYSEELVRLVASLLRKKPRFRPTVDQVAQDPFVARFLQSAAQRREIEDRERLLGESLLK